MKTVFLYVVSLLCIPLVSFEQEVYRDTIPEFLKNTIIPNFKVQLKATETDTVWFTNDSLPANRPVVLIYFSPECGHCQFEAEEIIKHVDSLKNAFFVWMSYGYTLEQLDKFYKKYGLDKCSNMRLGKLTVYKIPAFYKIQFTPYMAVYDRQKRFVAEFRKGAKMPALIDLLYR